MLFVIMTGIAAGILFIMSSWLRKMQHNDKLHTSEIVGEN